MFDTSDSVVIPKDRADILRDYHRERERQLQLWGEQRHSWEKWLAILSEEVGEYAKEILEGSGARTRNMRNELVQIAAVVTAALEQFDDEEREYWNHLYAEQQD